MAERLSRWGIGPKITASAAVWAAFAWFVTSAFPEVCVVESLRHAAVTRLAFALIALGLPLWLAGAIAVMRAYNQDRLVTTGMFALVRHPIYSAWIVLLLPGLTLLTRSWPFLLTPVVAYVVFRRLIHREDVYLAKRFGKAYLEYRNLVNEIIPIPRLRRG